MARGVPHDLASKPAASRPDGESWDFDENEQDFGEEENPLKPHASVTTSNSITNSKCPLCNPSQSQNHCCDLHNVVDTTVP
jgi:hypothetical protein